MKKILLTALLFMPLCVYAGAVDKLKNFMSATQSAQAEFTQTVYDEKGKRMQNAVGLMQFQRPGKFRWAYKKPYEQIIVGDGAKFWLYDVDLSQVTVKKLDEALGSSPAALLSGNNEIERGFNLKDNSMQGGIEWLEAIPKSNDTSFARIMMGFDAQANLVAMELIDMFNHKTVLKFTAIQRNAKIPAQQFQFTPPKGVDVFNSD